MAQVTTLGIDLAKNLMCVHGVDTHGHVVVKKRLSRQKLLPFVAQLPPCLIGMEASGGAHYWARELTKLGHTVKLLSPQFVKPYVQSQKNDPNDAAGICEAVERPRMRGVPVKSVTQQDVQALHRIRERQIKARTALINQIRGLLVEYGIVIPQRASQVRGDKNFKRHFRLAAPAVRPRRRPLLARGDGGSPSTRRPHAAVDGSKAWRGNARPGHAAEDAFR
jgi:transposase